MLRFVCVLPSHYEASECMKDIYSFCNERGIDFDLRVFDSKKYSQDAQYIESLPALHVYNGRLWQNTLHEDDGLFDKIKLMANEKRKPMSIFKQLKSYFRQKRKV